MPKISIIIPVFNVSAYLSRCLESVLGQDMEDIEVLVVDDCSTDSSAAIIEEMAAKDKRLKPIRHEVNHGTMWARESGLEEASGDYVMFVDGDDAVKPSICGTLYDAAVREDADMVICGYEVFYGDGSSATFSQALPCGGTARGVLKSLLAGTLSYTLWGKLFRKDLIKEYKHIHRQSFNNAEDGTVISMIAPHVKKAILLTDHLYLYYMNPGSATQKRLSEKAMDNIAVANAYRLSSVDGFPDLKDEAERFVVRVFFNMVKNGYDRKVVSATVRRNGLWDVLSFGNLRRLLGPRKALTYWAVTHVDGIAGLIYKKD